MKNAKAKLEIYKEFYKRGLFGLIPIGKLPDGELFFPTPKQKQALEYLNDEVTESIGYGGAARSGKSVIECMDALFISICYDGIQIAVCRKELTNLKRTVLVTLFKLLNFYGIKSNEFNYNQQLNKITFLNGSVIYLIDTAYKPSDPLNTRFGGFELIRCYIDESNETSLQVIDKLFERIGWGEGINYGLTRKMFECFNPDKNHVYNRFYIPNKENKETVETKFVLALPSDNPHPSVKPWIKSMIKRHGINSAIVQRQIFGNFEIDDDPSTLCDYNKIIDLFTNNFVPNINDKMYLTADIASENDKFVVCIWSGWDLVYIHTVDNKTAKNKSDGKVIQETIGKLCHKFKVPTSNVTFDATGAGMYLKGYFKNAIPFISAAKPYEGKRSSKDTKEPEKTYQNLKAQCYFYLSRKINNSEMYISANISEYEKSDIIEELSTIKDHSYGTDRKKSVTPKKEMIKYLGHSSDYSDAIKMRAIFDLRPKPRRIVTKFHNN